MTFQRLLQNTPLFPEDIERLATAYEQLRALDLKERDDPLAQAVAKKIIEIGQSGIRDPAQISQLAIKAFRDLLAVSNGTNAPSAKPSRQGTYLPQMRREDALFVHRGGEAGICASRVRMHEMPKHAEFCHASLNDGTPNPPCF